MRADAAAYIEVRPEFAIIGEAFLSARLYLDHAATTPLLPEAAAAMAEGYARWANPSSPHAEGRAARAALEDARGRIAQSLGWPGAVIFTSGATEAIELAARRAQCGERLASAVEHDAVLRAIPENERLPVQPMGHVSMAALEEALTQTGPGALIAIQAVNSETGVVQPSEAQIGAIHAAGGLALVDCAQSAGKLPLPANADFISISAHKLGGPVGIGALLVRDLALLRPTGGQEQGYRGGTENLPAALGFAAALDNARSWLPRAEELRRHLEQAIEAGGGVIVAKGARRQPSIGSYRMPGVTATAQLIQFDMAGIAVSAGSACSSGSMKPSHVLAAMGWKEDEAREVIRVSFGPTTARADIYRFLELWTRLARDARERAA
ncbi:cysteine desulfurase family protein [Flavisphingomonas formosensis]|uniref:cysteine desulfurase family protein n=1 Tax=Flavisphingomonas formosensis TaxID=861534 RepID=UPI0012F8F2D5|nr:aminotransferase class V-fold PLP-dependent enzyme [Sphingomonas formosensis]